VEPAYIKSMAMDSNMSDESRSRRREEALARRLGEALDQQASPRGPEPCPDGELIAAYRERELGPEEAAACEMHFAACSRCRKILAVLAASDDTPLAEKEVARLGELVAAAQVPYAAAFQLPREAPPQGTTIILPRRPDWRVRWLAPAVGVAAVLVVWFSIRPPWRAMEQGSQGSSETLVAQAPKNEPLLPPEPAPNDQLSQTAPAKKLGNDSATSSTNPPATPNMQSSAPMESPAPLPREMAKGNPGGVGAMGGLSAGGRVPENAPQKEEKVSPESNVAQATVAPPPAPPAQTPTVFSERAESGRSEAAGGNGPASDKQASAEQKAGATRSAATGNFLALSKLDQVREAGVQIKAPSGRVLWRVGSGGRIERSTNAGGVWILQSSQSTDEWLAGAAATDQICWIVGRNGAIARTTDGEHWEKIAPPASSADISGKFPDWIAVTVSGAQTATISASDQRRFTTQDSGKTWQLQ
jgi:Putative zinc-finger